MIKREKKRYLALEFESEHPLNKKSVFDAVQVSVIRLFGEYGASKTNLKMIIYLPEKRQFVICCSHSMLEKVKAAITTIMEINGKTAVMHVLGISGTLKALFKKI